MLTGTAACICRYQQRSLVSDLESIWLQIAKKNQKTQHAFQMKYQFSLVYRQLLFHQLPSLHILAHFYSCAQPRCLFVVFFFCKTSHANVLVRNRPVSQQPFWLIIAGLTGMFPVILIRALFPFRSKESRCCPCVCWLSVERLCHASRAFTPVSRVHFEHAGTFCPNINCFVCVVFQTVKIAG